MIAFENYASSINLDDNNIDWEKYMDKLQGQIGELRAKLDRLYELVEQIDERVQKFDSQPKFEQESYSLPNFASGSVQIANFDREADYQLTHKDILVDDNSSSSASSGNDNLAPDTQIRRLTAQLTAAYNRIAALEEQLLTYRIHH